MRRVCMFTQVHYEQTVRERVLVARSERGARQHYEQTVRGLL
jgi:hypothetical protein